MGTRGIDQQKGGSMNNDFDLPKCDNCGGVNVYRKRIAYFRDNHWREEPFCDEYHCSECGNESVDMSAWFGSAKKEKDTVNNAA